MDKAITSQRQPIAGLDILKFWMALLVVAIHSEAVNDYHPLYELTWPMINSAVPLFFTISSFLIFKKFRKGIPPKN